MMNKMMGGKKPAGMKKTMKGGLLAKAEGMKKPTKGTPVPKSKPEGTMGKSAFMGRNTAGVGNQAKRKGLKSAAMSSLAGMMGMSSGGMATKSYKKDK